MSDWKVANKIETFAKIGVPEFVATRESLEGSFVDDESLLEGGIGTSDKVAPPELKAEWVAENLLFVE